MQISRRRPTRKTTAPSVKASRSYKHLAGRLLGLFGLLALIALAHDPQETVADARTCRIGAYVTDLYDLEVSPRTVNADFWLWAVCPHDEMDATRRLDFVNATQVSQSSASLEKVGDKYWSQVKISGTFRQEFDLSEYPFDKQNIRILVEDSELSDSEFAYVADAVNSGYDPAAIQLGGFEITKFQVKVDRHTYKTSFGDPRITQGKSSRYSQFVIEIGIARVDVAGFIRQAWPVYVAFLIALISYFIWSPEFMKVAAPRFGILGAALFAVVVNLRTSVSGAAPFGVTLIDQIHLITLLYLLIGVAVTTYLVWTANDEARARTARHVNYLAVTVTTALYLAGNAVTLAFAFT
ncbi:hypothetical protein [Streptomyces wuyuanensis]|uniref:hypothetical protein n=1 Tax=Streptomyces wuyuanensis TaxID=1196353 RepID=UPI00341481CF